jgi:hypothetical protein
MSKQQEMDARLQNALTMIQSVTPPLSVLGTPVKVGIRWSFLVVWPGSAVLARGGPQPGSRWSARSAARTNDLEAGEDPPHADGRVNEAKRQFVVQVICCLPS